MLQISAPIIEHLDLGCGMMKLTLQHDLATHAQPGQFLHIRVSDGTDPLLRRPISIHTVNPEDSSVSLIYKIIGRGTTCLSRFDAGQHLDCLGPLGSGFTLQGQKPLLVGAGMGLAPLYFLAQLLQNRNIVLLAGAQHCEGLLAYQQFAALCTEVFVTTDDGSMGQRGRVGDLLPDVLDRCGCDMVYACGPKPVLRSVQQLAIERNIPCQLSLEAFMGCGVGACLGCTVPAVGGGYQKVCTDGPVFWGTEVVLP